MGCTTRQHRHAMYRWHVMDPIRFERDLRVTIQALGWRGDGRYLPTRPEMSLGGLLVPDAAHGAVPGPAGSR